MHPKVKCYHIFSTASNEESHPATVSGGVDLLSRELSMLDIKTGSRSSGNRVVWNLSQELLESDTGKDGQKGGII